MRSSPPRKRRPPFDAAFIRETASFSEKPKDWTGLQVRRANRVLFHVLFPDLIAPPEPAGLARVMRYLGRGNTLGEIGLVLNRPRSATCMAYSHPDADREATHVELVRVPADVVREMEAQSPAVRAEIKKIAATLTASDIATPVAALTDLSQSRRVEELGLLQGQKLMLTIWTAAPAAAIA
jgi:CRP-like cAMP-binding protein